MVEVLRSHKKLGTSLSTSGMTTPSLGSAMLPISGCIRVTLTRRRARMMQVLLCLWASQAYDWHQSCEVLPEAVRVRLKEGGEDWQCPSSTRL